MSGGFRVTSEGAGSRPHQGKEHPLFTKTLDQGASQRGQVMTWSVACVWEPVGFFFKGGYTQKDISNKKTLGSQEGSNVLIPTLSFKILPSHGIQKSTGTQLPNSENDSARIRKPQHLLLNHTFWRDTEVDCTEKKKIPTLTCFYFSLIKKNLHAYHFFYKSDFSRVILYIKINTFPSTIRKPFELERCENFC